MISARSTTSLPRPGLRLLALALLSAFFGNAVLLVAAPATAAPNLVGTLRLTPGSCAGGKVTGTYLRMILPSGGQNGPFMANNDSRCADQSYTPLSPGTDGGLRVGSYQPQPSPVFTSEGDARAGRITAPATFYGTSFATATNAVDPQTRIRVPAPRVTTSGSTITADLRSFAVSWNNQHFNQGAPKPDSSRPGNTRTATGTYDPATRAFTLTWSSQVVGGPFDKFTGQWHLEGTFVPDAVPAATAQPGTSADGGAAAPTTRAGSVTAPGAVPVAGRPVAAQPGAAPAAATTQTLQAPATVETVTVEKWRVSWPVIGLAIGIALVAIGSLVLANVLGRRAGS